MEQPNSDAPAGGALPGALEALASRLSDAGEGTVSAETNTALHCTAATQTELPAVDGAQLRVPALAAFLRRAGPRCEAALQQNELADPLLDALANLVDDEAGEAGAAAGSHSGAGSSAAGLVEHQSFSDLLRSKGRPLAAACFHPTRRGVVAVAVAGSGGAPPPASRQPAAGAPTRLAPHPAQLGCILVWSHGDAIHPEAVLQAPAEVTALAWHPTQQHVLAAGLSTGQVALFHLHQKAGPTGSGAATAVPSGRTAAAGSGGQAGEGGQEGSSHSAELLPLHLSMPEASHQAAVADLHWLPGVVLSRDGRLEAAAPRGEGGGAAGPAGASDGCTLFATAAADGALLVWDMHISARHRKHAGKGEQLLAGGVACVASWPAACGMAITCPPPTCLPPKQRRSSQTGSPLWPWLLPALPGSRCWPPGSMWMLVPAHLVALWLETWLASWRRWMQPATVRSGGWVLVPDMPVCMLARRSMVTFLHCMCTACMSAGWWAVLCMIPLFPTTCHLSGQQGVGAQHGAWGSRAHGPRAGAAAVPLLPGRPAGCGRLRLCSVAHAAPQQQRC